MLEMADGIPKEAVATIGGVFQNPFECGIRPRPCFQDGVVIGKFCGECPVELQDSLGGFPLKPMTLGETQGIKIEGCAPTLPVPFLAGGITGRKIRAGFHEGSKPRNRRQCQRRKPY